MEESEKELLESIKNIDLKKLFMNKTYAEFQLNDSFSQAFIYDTKVLKAISQEKSAISKIKELADQGNKDAEKILEIVAENIKEINQLLNIK